MNRFYPFCCFIFGLGMTFSVNASWPRYPADGWIVGGSLAHADLKGELHTQIDYRGTPTVITPVATEIRDKGTLYGFFIGYQQIRQRWLMGVEGSVDWLNVDRTHRFAFNDAANFLTWTSNTKYQRGTAPSLSGRLGYVLLPYFIPYIRLGAEVSRDKLWSEFRTPNATTLFPYTVTPQGKAWVYRCLSGVGVEMPIPCTVFTFRLEYNYHSKGKTVESDEGYIDGVINPMINNDLQPQMQSYRFSMVYHFL